MIRPINMVPAKAKLFRSVGEESRLTVLEALIPGERHVTDLAEYTQQSQSTVSTHLAALHGVGLVIRAHDGRQVRYGLAHPSVVRLLAAAEETVLSTSGQEYACASPCCNTPEG